MCWTPGQADQVRALARADCVVFLGKTFTLIVPLFTHRCINWHRRIYCWGSRNTPSRFMLSYGNRDKLRPDGPLGSYTDLTYLLFKFTSKPLAAILQYEFMPWLHGLPASRPNRHPSLWILGSPAKTLPFVMRTSDILVPFLTFIY